MAEQSIICPSCRKGTINVTLKDLLYGKSFICKVCNTSIALGSHVNEAGEDFKKLERLK